MMQYFHENPTLFRNNEEEMFVAMGRYSQKET